MYLSGAEDILRSVKALFEKYPAGAGYHLKVLQRSLDQKAPTIVLASGEDTAIEGKIFQALRTHYIPHATIVFKRWGDELLNQVVPTLAEKVAIEGQATLYICRQDGCLAPILDEEAMVAALLSL